MKHFTVAALAACCLALAACRSKGPAFDARPGAAVSPSDYKAMTNTADIEEQSFTNLARANQLTPEMRRMPKDPYRLGPGDTVDIEIVGDPASKSPALVGPDGKIYYGMLPGTFIWGMTLNETREELEKGLKKFMRAQPDITVTLRLVSSKTVWVLGTVQQPGVYPLAAPMTVLEALTAAGGPAQSPNMPISTGGAAAPAAFVAASSAESLEGVCDLQRSFVMREGKVLPIDFVKLLRHGDMTQNVYLQPNDFIYLRPGVTRNVYVIGAVGAPRVVSFRNDITLLAAIASAGGPMPYAYQTDVAIIRGSLAEPRIASVDYKAIRKGESADVRLQAGDIIYVPYVPWRKIAMFLEGMLNTFVVTIASNEGYNLSYPNFSPVGPVVPVTTGQ